MPRSANGPRRSTFVIETNTKFLRESDIITESEADTPCKRLYFALTLMYLADDATLAENSFVEQANALMEAARARNPTLRRSTSKFRAATCVPRPEAWERFARLRGAAALSS